MYVRTGVTAEKENNCELGPLPVPLGPTLLANLGHDLGAAGARAESYAEAQAPSRNRGSGNTPLHYGHVSKVHE
jgi:hypothetical protein